MEEISVVSSTLGFEALLLNKKVNCYGLPWYSGWGLTVDKIKESDINEAEEKAFNRRIQKRTVEELFYLAYIEYTTYYDYVNLNDKGDIYSAIEYIQKQKEFYDKYLSLNNKFILYNFKKWKEGNLKDIFPEKNSIFIKKIYTANGIGKLTETVSVNDNIVVWGNHVPKQF